MVVTNRVILPRTPAARTTEIVRKLNGRIKGGEEGRGKGLVRKGKEGGMDKW